jgi:hypothetical protein
MLSIFAATIARWVKSQVSCDFPMVTQQTLSQARAIVKFAPELADQVLSNGTTFSKAFDESVVRRVQSETNAEKLARLRKLRAELYDLETRIRSGPR